MASKEDWAAAMDSEIFREYVRNEVPKLAQEKTLHKQAAIDNMEQKVDAELKVYEDFAEFEKKVQASPELKNKLRKIKAVLLENPETMKTADPNFVDGILMLDLDEESNDS